MLMINNHFALFQLPGNLLKNKKCAPYFRGNTEFPIYLILLSKLQFGNAGNQGWGSKLSERLIT
jgi:hypothetical protein